MTQNPNESFNSTIWERISKTIYCGVDTLELGVYDAVANYNYGRKPTLDIYHHLNIKPGYYTIKLCHMLNARRKYNVVYHEKSTTKKRRNVLRGEKKKKNDKHVYVERASYEPGGLCRGYELWTRWFM